jgi:hypothetical protein
LNAPGHPAGTGRNLHSGRLFRSGDSIAGYNLFADHSLNKPATLFDQRMINLQKQYASDLLGHVNPYTGFRLADGACTTETTLSGVRRESAFFTQPNRSPQH